MMVKASSVTAFCEFSADNRIVGILSKVSKMINSKSVLH